MYAPHKRYTFVKCGNSREGELEYYSPFTAPLVVDNIGQYGNINHQPVGRLTKYISPHLASEQPSYASLNLGYR